MQKALAKFFNSDLVFLIMTIIVVLTSALYIVLYSVFFSPAGIIISALFAGCSIVLYVSYKKHDKNVMKGMLGAFLMMCLYYSILQINLCITTWDYIFTGIYIAGTLVFFINHFIINSSHLSSPKNVFLSELLCIGCFILDIAWNVFYFITENSAWDTWCYIWYISDVFNLLAVLGVVVCVQQKLDLHRIAREEKGYIPPEK